MLRKIHALCGASQFAPYVKSFQEEISFLLQYHPMKSVPFVKLLKNPGILGPWFCEIGFLNVERVLKYRNSIHT